MVPGATSLLRGSGVIPQKNREFVIDRIVCRPRISRIYCIIRNYLSPFILLAAIGCSSTGSFDPSVVNSHLYVCEQFDVVKAKMVRLINQARSSSRICGTKIYPPVGTIAWNPTLARVAFEHSVDMATKDRVSHSGTDGSSVSERVERKGYVWSNVGENISAGRESSEEVVGAWLRSPHHCEVIMKAEFVEIGGSCFHNKDTRYKTFWTVVFATPK